MDPNTLCATFRYPNGYGATINKCRNGFWNLTRLSFDENDEANIVGDTIGFMTEQEVTEELKEIEALWYL